MSTVSQAGPGAEQTPPTASVPQEKQEAQIQPPSEERCANCQTPLLGRYCHACGQSAHLHHNLWHLAEEALHGIFHFDTKVWRTLWSLIRRPGTLTLNYSKGRRANYVSPLALFLFMIFLMFLIFSWTNRGSNLKLPSGPQSVAEALTQSVQEIRQLEEKLKDKALSASDRQEALEELALLRKQESFLRLQQGLEGKSGAGRVQGGGEADWQRGLREMQISGSDDMVTRMLLRAQANPELLMFKLKGAASSYAFLLVPLALPFLWLMFLRRRDLSMYDHAIFALYSLSFMAMLMIVLSLLAYIGLTGLAAGLFFLVPPLHMFVQLRGSYQLDFSGALWRTLVLLAVACCSCLAYVTLILYMSMK